MALPLLLSALFLSCCLWEERGPGHGALSKLGTKWAMWTQPVLAKDLRALLWVPIWQGARGAVQRDAESLG